MSIADTTYIVGLSDKNRTKICKFCGKPIKQIPKEDITGNVRDWGYWTEYECDCKEWQKYEKCIQSVNTLNEKLLETYDDYKEQLRNTDFRKYGVNVFKINRAFSKEF